MWKVRGNERSCVTSLKNMVFSSSLKGSGGRIKGLLLELGHRMGFNLGSGEYT